MEFIVRLVFVFFLIGLYIIGHIVSNLFNLPIDLKIILPLLSTVFLDNWIRLYSHRYYSIKCCHKSLTNTCLELNYLLTYRGTYISRFEICLIENMKDVNVSLKLNNVDENKKKKYEVPEQFSTTISPNQPTVNFTLYFNFKDTPAPTKFKLFNYSFIVFFPEITFSINGKKNKKHFWIYFLRGNDYG